MLINQAISPLFSKPMNYVTFYHNSITIHQLKSSPLHILLIKLDNYEKGMDMTEMEKEKAHIIVKIIEYLPNTV